MAPIDEKRKESRLRWFCHVQWRPTKASVKKSKMIPVEEMIKGNGRPKITLVEIVLKKMTCQLSIKEETKGITSNIMEWRKEYMWPILTNLLRIHRWSQEIWD